MKSHRGKCDRLRRYHPYWTKTKKIKVCERKSLEIDVDILKGQLSFLEDRSRATGLLFRHYTVIINDKNCL